MLTERFPDEIIAARPHFSNEQLELRRSLLTLPLEETVKWGLRCYTWRSKDVVGIGGFKQYFGLWFCQGALLEDGQDRLPCVDAGPAARVRTLRQ